MPFKLRRLFLFAVVIWSRFVGGVDVLTTVGEAVFRSDPKERFGVTLTFKGQSEARLKQQWERFPGTSVVSSRDAVEVRIKNVSYAQLTGLQAPSMAGLSDLKIRLSPIAAAHDQNARDLVNLLRSVYRPEHWAQVRSLNAAHGTNLPEKPPISERFLEKLLSPGYHPDLEDLLVDAVYRPALERAGEKSVWTLSRSKVKERALQRIDHLDLPPGETGLDIAPFLLSQFPKDPVAKRLGKGAAAEVVVNVLPLEENLGASARKALGLLQAVKQYGYYDHDSLLSEASRIPKDTIHELREKSYQSIRTGKQVLVKNLFGTPGKTSLDDHPKVKPLYDGFVVPVFSQQPIGILPVVIPGESIVWHRWGNHGGNIRGKYNPGLANPNTQEIFENKYLESLLWEDYAPGAIPKTRLVADVIGKETDPEKIAALLKKAFPKGWVMKGAYDSATVGNLVTDKTDLVGALRTYRSGDYEAFRKKVEKDFEGKDPDEMYYEFTQHNGYMGYKIATALAAGHDSLIQEKVDIDREYRVEVSGGKVLGQGSTVDRWAFLLDEEIEAGAPGAKERKAKFVPSSPQAIAEAEAWAQSIVDKLPEALRHTPFGLDVARLKNGSFVLIESNPGGNSGFLIEQPATVKVHNEFLKRYPEWVRQGILRGKPFSPEEEMAFLKNFLKKHKIDMDKVLPDVVLHPDHVEGYYAPVRIRADQYQIRRVPGKQCTDRLAELTQ